MPRFASTDANRKRRRDPSSVRCAATFSRRGRRGGCGAAPHQAKAARAFDAQGVNEAERKLWHLLRDRRFSGFKFRRQVQIGTYIVDFACPAKRLIVEADGGQHAESAYDKVRDAWLTAEGFRIRRFWNADIFNRPDEVSDTLWHDLDGATLHDSSLKEEKE